MAPILTQDVQQMPFYKLTATNPGQFFYNLSIEGVPGSTRKITLEMPWGFVTQGARPIHVYDGVSFVEQQGGGYCFKPGNEAASIASYVVLE